MGKDVIAQAQSGEYLPMSVIPVTHTFGVCGKDYTIKYHLSRLMPYLAVLINTSDNMIHILPLAFPTLCSFPPLIAHPH